METETVGAKQRSLTTTLRPEQLRIAIVSDAEAGRNGVGAYYCDLTDQLREHVAAIATFGPSTHNKHRWLTLPLPGDATQRIWVPPALRIRREIQALKPNVVIVPTPGPYGVLGWYLSTRIGARLIFGFHTHYENLTALYWRQVRGRITRGYFEVLNKVLFRDSEIVLANSERMLRTAQAAGARKVALMGTPLPRSFLVDPMPGSPLKVERVFFAGRLAAEKNVNLIVQAAAELPQHKFYISGEGPLRVEIERAARKMPNLTYLGWTERSRMRTLVDTMDMVVLPSAVESFGTIALEAMARGRLVLVSGSCGILDWCEMNRALFRIDPGETLGAAIRRVAGMDEAIRREKSELAREAAVKLNDWSIRSWLSMLACEDHS